MKKNKLFAKHKYLKLIIRNISKYYQINILLLMYTVGLLIKINQKFIYIKYFLYYIYLFI